MVMTFLYFVIQESSEAKATLGKKMVSIEVVSTEYTRITFSQACGRYFAKILSSLAFCLGYLAITWTEKSQGWHDSLANTLVVRKDIPVE